MLSEKRHGESLSLQTVTPYVIPYYAFVETEPKADLQVASNGQPGVAHNTPWPITPPSPLPPMQF